MRFGGDWTGVFIRGDNAAYYAMQLNYLLDRLTELEQGDDKETFMFKATIRGLMSDLSSCLHTTGKDPAAQVMKEFEECIDEEEAGESEA
jgi:hypothetical protein